MRRAPRRAGHHRAHAVPDRDRHARLQYGAGGPGRVDPPAPRRLGRGARVRLRDHRRLHSPVRAGAGNPAHPQGEIRQPDRANAGGGAPPAHQRHARARRPRRRRDAQRFHRPGELRAAALPRPQHLVAVLAGARHWAEVVPPGGVGRTAAHRPARVIRELRRIPTPCRRAGALRHHPRQHRAVVGRAAQRALPDPGNAHPGPVHPRRGRGVHRGAVPLLAAAALPPAAQQPALAALPAAAHRGEPLARPPIRHGRGPDRLRARRGGALPRSR